MMLKKHCISIGLIIGFLLVSNQSEANGNGGKVDSLLSLGNTSCKKGEYDLGMQSYIEALEIINDSNHRLRFKTLLKIANVYTALQSYDRALNYYSLASEVNDRYEEGEHPEILLGFGMVAYGKRDSKLAKEKYLEAIKKAKIKNDHRTVLTARLNIASLLEADEKYDSALTYYQTLEHDAVLLNDSVSYCYSLWGQGDCFTQLNKFQEAELKLNNALEIGRRIGAKDRLSEIQGSLAQLKLASKQYETAAGLLLAEKIGKDSLLGPGVIDKVIMLEESSNHLKVDKSNFFGGGSKLKWYYFVLAISTLVLIFFLYYRKKESFLQWITYRQQGDVSLPVNEGNKNVDDKELKRIIIDLQTMMEKEKLYLNKDLDIWQLSKQMGINKNKLSKAINHHEKLNFKQYINDLRIAEAKKLLADEDILARYTIESIALKCGFKTKVNFNYVFKQKLQQTPSQFILEHTR